MESKSWRQRCRCSFICLQINSLKKRPTCSNFLEKASSSYKRFLEIWCLIVATIFSGYLSFYLWKMLLISYDFQERSEGADEILIWIPQTSVAIGSLIFFIAVLHKFILTILSKND